MYDNCWSFTKICEEICSAIRKGDPMSPQKIKLFYSILWGKEGISQGGNSTI